MDIPQPYPSQVISYEYLWHDQSVEGIENGDKARPCVVVLARKDNCVMVLPITSQQPRDMSCAVELPERTVKRMGLSKRSWVICSELNQFTWPGPDLCPIGKTGQPEFGKVPDLIFDAIREKIAFVANGKKLRIVPRTAALNRQ